MSQIVSQTVLEDMALCLSLAAQPSVPRLCLRCLHEEGDHCYVGDNCPRRDGLGYLDTVWTPGVVGHA